MISKNGRKTFEFPDGNKGDISEGQRSQFRAFNFDNQQEETKQLSQFAPRRTKNSELMEDDIRAPVNTAVEGSDESCDMEDVDEGGHGGDAQGRYM